MQRFMVAQNELLQTRRVLINASGNLDDVTRIGNSTAQLPAEAKLVLAQVARTVQAVDETVAAVSAALADARPRARRRAHRH
jgi:hypothetical protein